jgi:hypothetical protein
LAKRKRTNNSLAKRKRTNNSLAKRKRTNNDLHNNTLKTKHRATRTPLITQGKQSNTNPTYNSG